jgi:hypothetical protein
MDTTAIIEQLEEEKERLEAAITALSGAGPNHRRKGRRRMSPAARERIAAAQRKRWKAFKKAQKA